VNSDVVSSLIEGPVTHEIPFVYVVDHMYGSGPDYPVNHPLDHFQDFYKVAIELIGEFWFWTERDFPLERLRPSIRGGVDRTICDMATIWETNQPIEKGENGPYNSLWIRPIQDSKAQFEMSSPGVPFETGITAYRTC